ncbi:hypothetical protein DAPPUDRAFT_240021 [Daphnia pulex]|uniref:Uncharacterized protein n=1 Tax=Daphnia pulex TaxID=6669 RepID=E9GAP6_DAPPU|nr:hypothetical protein DAPPUDRAFT_240021 [Daphnia pulex]|eukprot:EFX83293.1 hypothetical protein DAPPUDRAFT_240021 [Daphnia pulex]
MDKHFHPSPATSTCRRKDQFACPYTFEGHGYHYEKRIMEWCRGWTHPQQHQPAEGKTSLHVLTLSKVTEIITEKARDISRVSTTDTASTAVSVAFTSQLPSSSQYQFATMVNHIVVLLSGVVSLMAGSNTGVPMSSEYGGYQITTPSPYYTTTT